MKKNSLMLAFVSLLSMTVAGCGDNKNSSTPNSTPSTPSTRPSITESAGKSEDVSVMPSEDFSEDVSSDDPIWGPHSTDDQSWDISQEIDFTGLIPQDVLDANVNIDFIVYIEGQNKVIEDIGNYSPDPNDKTRKYHPEDLTSIEMAKYFAAASAFKTLAPNVKINLWYCSIADYPQLIQDYVKKNHHIPHLMWGTDHVVEMMGDGYNYDLSRYASSEYYNQYNEYFMSRFNFGGFQAGFPIAAEPWGVYVNLGTLKEYNILSNDAIDPEIGQCSDEYQEWVTNFTWDNFVDAAKKSNNDTHAGLSKMVEYFTSYSVPSINDQFIREGTVDISSSEILGTMTKLLEYENELSQYCVYKYDDTSVAGRQLIAKDFFSNAAAWRGTENFVKDQYSTFYAEAPWALGGLSQYVKTHDLDTKVDFLPYPRLNMDTPAYTGIAVEGLTVGNQCPVGTPCTSDKQLEMDVASYFAMFMGLDPRAIEARKNVKYIFDGVEYTGDLTLPITKRGSKYAWQTEGETADPAEGFADNWQYQLSLWFDVYDLYVTNDQPADVEFFSNITYGLVQMLDSMYMLDGIGDDDNVNCLNFWNEPVNVPGEDADGNEIVKDIFDRWQGRFRVFSDSDTNAGVLGTDSYVSAVLANLADVEAEINENSAIAWAYLQECVETFYEKGKYDVTDKSWRNQYEGHK